ADIRQDNTGCERSSLCLQFGDAALKLGDAVLDRAQRAPYQRYAIGVIVLVVQQGYCPPNRPTAGRAQIKPRCIVDGAVEAHHSSSCNRAMIRGTSHLSISPQHVVSSP